MLEQPVGQVFEPGPRDALPPRQRLHLILLGMDNVARATAFYEALGWTRSPTGNEGFAKFDLGGHALCLISRQALAQDAGFDFADPDGHLFEVDYEDAWVFGDDDRLVVDKVNA